MLQYCTCCNSLKIFCINFVKILVDLPYLVYLLLKAWLISLWRMLSRRHKSLDNETILVTGAASGLGQLVVLKLAKLSGNAVFVLWDINATGLAETADKCREIGAHNVHTYLVDLSNQEDVLRTASMVRTQVGAVTILFNNAGTCPYNLFLDTDACVDEKILRVNLLSQMWTIKEFLPDMILRGKGHVVSTCSGLAFHRFPYLASYVASKHGLRGFLETLRVEIEMHPGKPNIKISIIYPGWVTTPMTTGLAWVPRYNLNVLSRMDPEQVSSRMVDGLLAEEEEIIIPSSLKHLILLNGYLPSRFTRNLFENHLFRNITLQKNEEFTV